MIGELLFLIGAAFFTAGASSAAGPAVMAGGRWAIQRVFRELLKRLLERGLKTVTKDAVKAASKKITKDSLKRFGKTAAKHARREGLEEFGTEYAIEMHQIASGHRQGGLDALSLGMSFAGGAAGGAFGGLAGLGPNARTGLGHTFEAMGAGGPSSTGGSARKPYAGGSDPGGTTHAGGSYVGAGQDGITVHSGSDVAGTTVHGGTHVTVDTSAGPAAGSVPGMTPPGYAAADLAGVATVNPPHGLDVSPPGPATPGTSNPAGLSGVPGQANPSGPVAFVPGVGTPNVTTPNV